MMSCFRRIFQVAAVSAAVMGSLMSTAYMAKVPANSPEISYYGRWDERHGVESCGYGATYVKAKFTGTGLKADIRGAGIWWRVSIDGGEFRRFKPRGRNTVLAENLPEGEHTLLLVRSTEGQAGVGRIRSFTVDDGCTFTAPEPQKKRRLEFVGDSITAGAVNDGIRIGNNYNDVEDNDMAYGPQLARMLGADYSVVAKSGQGIVHNYAETKRSKGAVHAADSYQWTFFSNKFRKENLKWDTARFPVDAIIIALGTNDLSDPQNRPTPEKFQAGYENLIGVIRRMNPGKAIICTEPVPKKFGDMSRDTIRRTVEKVNDAGDKDVYFIPINENGSLLYPLDYVDGTHPTKRGATVLAEYLKDKVAAILGWR